MHIEEARLEKKSMYALTNNIKAIITKKKINNS